ncbi:unnamed protein product [Candida verbasci]|uniref:ribose-phosphate diphosphokinase n=1 Tax=Candida verbasci TaxID=1227364 RepID=A0A9W4TWN7_9ASCO|nr:unnamed protein product [Candida verbasci]
MRDLLVLGGTSHPNLTKSICRNLTIQQTEVLSKKFSNGETSIEISESVREKDVFIVQSSCGHVNDNFLELLITIAACKTASAKRVTAVLPLFPYSRQPDIPFLPSLSGAPSISETKEYYTFESAPSTPRPLSRNSESGKELTNNSSSSPLEKKIINNNNLKMPIPNRSVNFQPKAIVTNSASVNFLPQVDENGKTESGYKQWISPNGTLIANLLTTAGADRLVTMDLHDPQFQGFFNIPVDNLYSRPLLKHYIMDYIPNYQECIIVSPDSGGAKRATAIADSVGCSFALIHKERRAKFANQPPSTSSSSMSVSMSQQKSLNSNYTTMIPTTMLVGDVKDKVCVLIDDLVDTSYTITRAAKLLKDEGAKYVYALVTHGVFSGDAINRIKKSGIDKLVTTNSVPQSEHVAILGDQIEVLDVSRIFAESIRRINNGESVSMLFDYGW